MASLYRDNECFTSEGGNVLETLLQGGDSAAGRMLAVSDGHRHKRLRQLVLKAFSPGALDVIIERVRVATRKLMVEAVAGDGECDFARDVAAHIPLTAICDLLGVPDQDRAYILSLTSSAISSDREDQTAADAWESKSEILLYFAGLARERRDNTPHNDVVGLLATSKIDGEDITHDEIMLNCYSLILGGDETARLSMIGAVQALIEHPEQWRSLKSGDAAIETAVEEVLRWTTPAIHSGRTAVVDTTVRGQEIKAGDIVTIWNSSANRDEEKFPEPGRFDLTRTPNRHLTFAYGPHFCLGAPLARVELGAVLEGLRTVASDIEPTGPARPIYSNFLFGLSSLPVRLKPDRESMAREGW
ncbi:cytochrome P450 [Kitasatospora sp. NPDC018058]|uniref:cytochrome P450 n=1 Tax=Kitasatospora sp. NPDC018058 TaxID=3364025 RepID=UPI0037C0AC78